LEPLVSASHQERPESRDGAVAPGVEEEFPEPEALHQSRQVAPALRLGAREPLVALADQLKAVGVVAR